MSTRLTARVGAAALVLALAAVPAVAQNTTTDDMGTTGTKPMHPARPHRAPMHSTSRGHQDTGDSMIEQLNAQSLSAAQSGQTFVPPGGSGGTSSDMGGSAPAPAPMRHKNM